MLCFEDIDFQKVKDLDPVDRAEIQDELKQKEINDFTEKKAIKKQAAKKKEATKQLQADDELANKKTDSQATPKEEANNHTIDIKDN